MACKGLRVARREPRSLIPLQACPDDNIHREFTASAPNQLRGSDFTYVSTWMGMVYVAFVIGLPPVGTGASNFSSRNLPRSDFTLMAEYPRLLIRLDNGTGAQSPSFRDL